MPNTPHINDFPDVVCGLKQQLSDLTTKVNTILSTPHQSKVTPIAPRFYGGRELAAYLHCTVQTISRLQTAGKIPFHRYGRKYFYLRSEIDAAFYRQDIAKTVTHTKTTKP